MNEIDAKVIKVLTDLKLRKEQQLSSEQEQILKRALDSEETFLHDVEKLFNKQ